MDPDHAVETRCCHESRLCQRKRRLGVLSGETRVLHVRGRERPVLLGLLPFVWRGTASAAGGIGQPGPYLSGCSDTVGM